MWLIVELLYSEDAATAVEYSVMLALILLAVLAAVTLVGTTTAGLWSDIANSMP